MSRKLKSLLAAPKKGDIIRVESSGKYYQASATVEYVSCLGVVLFKIKTNQTHRVKYHCWPLADWTARATRTVKSGPNAEYIRKGAGK